MRNSWIILIFALGIQAELFCQEEEKVVYRKYYNEQAMEGMGEYAIKLILYTDSTYEINSDRHYGPLLYVESSGTWNITGKKIHLDSFYSGKKLKKWEMKDRLIFKNKKFRIKNGTIILSRFFLDWLYQIKI